MKALFATIALVTLLSSSAHAQYGAGRGYDRAYAQVPPNAAFRPRVRNQQDYWWRLYEESSPAGTASTATTRPLPPIRPGWCVTADNVVIDHSTFVPAHPRFR